MLSAESTSEYIKEIVNGSANLLKERNISGKPIFVNTHTHNPLRIELSSNQDVKKKVKAY